MISSIHYKSNKYKNLINQSSVDPYFSFSKQLTHEMKATQPLMVYWFSVRFNNFHSNKTPLETRIV